MSVRIVLAGIGLAMVVTLPAFGQAQQSPSEPTEAAVVQPVPAVPALPAEPAGPVLSMDDAIATAVCKDPGLAQARERVLRGQNSVREATAQSRLTVGLQALYTRAETPTTVAPGAGGLGGQTGLFSFGGTSAVVTVTQPLDLSGTLSLGRKIARLGLDIQKYTEAQTFQQLIANVKAAYYSALRAQANVGVAQSSLNVAEERLKLAMAQFSAGVSPRFDVTTAQVDVANLQQSLIQAQSAYRIAKAVLNRTIGIEVDTPLTLKDQPDESAVITPVTLDIPALTSQALCARPEIAQTRVATDLSEHTVKLTGTQNKPQLSLSAVGSWSGDVSSFDLSNSTHTLTVGLNWPIWTGGVTQARVAEARNDVNIARRNLDQAALGVELDVRTNAQTVMEASRRVQTARANVALAQESLRLARVRYAGGVSIEIEVTNAESSLTQALTNEVNARYDYLTAKAQLQRATAAQPEYTAFLAHPSGPSLISCAPADPPVTAMPPVNRCMPAPQNPLPAQPVLTPKGAK